MARHSGGKVGKSGKTLASPKSSKTAKSKRLFKKLEKIAGNPRKPLSCVRLER